MISGVFSSAECARPLAHHLLTNVLRHIRYRSPLSFPATLSANDEDTVLGGEAADDLCECLSDVLDEDSGLCSESILSARHVHSAGMRRFELVTAVIVKDY